MADKYTSHFFFTFDPFNQIFFILIAVESLPTTYTGGFPGARAVPSIDGNGAYLQGGQYLYELVCTSSSCTWTVMEQQLSRAVNWAVMMYLPSDYNCTN